MILNIILCASVIWAFIFILIMHKKIMELQIKLEKTEERYNARFEDADKKIRIISNKKW